MSIIDLERVTRRALIKSIYDNTALKVQQTKLVAGNDWIEHLQDRVPPLMPPKDRIISYHTSTARNNAYNDYDTFRRVMLNSPKLAPKNFYFVGPLQGVDDRKSILAAARMAKQLVMDRTRMYPRSTAPDSQHQSTGNLYNSIRTFVNGSMVVNVQKAIMESEEYPIFEISNIAPYASTAEARSYYHRVGGIIWYAANRVQRAFPELGVFFGYVDATQGGPRGGMSTYGHFYQLPVLRIGSREDVSGAWTLPGQNHTKRVKQARRIERIFKDGS